MIISNTYWWIILFILVSYIGFEMIYDFKINPILKDPNFKPISNLKFFGYIFLLIFIPSCSLLIFVTYLKIIGH